MVITSTITAATTTAATITVKLDFMYGDGENNTVTGYVPYPRKKWRRGGELFR